MVSEVLLSNPLLPGAALIGLCGGAVLMLIYWYGQLGKVMLPVYGALFFALAYVAARRPTLPWAARFTSTLLGFCIATGAVYALSIYAGVQARREREASAAAAPSDGMQLREHALRVGLMLTAGAVLSAIVVSSWR